MKRYRVLSYDFDTRANVLSIVISDNWYKKHIEQWRANQKRIKEELITQFGEQNADQKIKNFIELDYLPISVIAFHTKFMRQIRVAYVIGAYYPALTSACALGERILNQLIIYLRDEYKDTKEYKMVYRKSSFNNWDLAINTLESWGVLLPNVTKDFKELESIRHSAIHFNPETDENDKELALGAIKKLTNIIEGQFSGFGTQPWFITDAKGGGYIKKEYEQVPFVKYIIIPNCALVGPYHTLKLEGNRWIIIDNYDYEAKDISDEEFIELINYKRRNLCE